jgi:hypothetical protein
MKKAIPVLFIFLIIAAIALIAFPPRNQMQRAVEEFGFQNVHLTGFAFLGCSEQDAFRQKWSGRNAAGKAVNGVICGGLAKGWTVRLT